MIIIIKRSGYNQLLEKCGIQAFYRNPRNCIESFVLFGIVLHFNTILNDA